MYDKRHSQGIIERIPVRCSHEGADSARETRNGSGRSRQNYRAATREHHVLDPVHQWVNRRGMKPRLQMLRNISKTVIEMAAR